MDESKGGYIPTGFADINKMLKGGIPRGMMSIIAPAPRRPYLPPGLNEREVAYYLRNVGVGKHGLPLMPPTPADFYSEGTPCWSSQPPYGIGEVNMRVAISLLKNHDKQALLRQLEDFTPRSDAQWQKLLRQTGKTSLTNASCMREMFLREQKTKLTSVVQAVVVKYYTPGIEWMGKLKHDALSDWVSALSSKSKEKFPLREYQRELLNNLFPATT